MKLVILQGDVFGPIECSVSVDTYGRECLKTDKYLYDYKDTVKVPMLAMVDDVVIVSECGYKATMANSYINMKSNMKKLQFGTNKCHTMHIGSKKLEEIYPDQFVDEWKMKEVKEMNTKITDIEDEYKGLHRMEEVKEERYLGDIIANDGKNTKDIAARKIEELELSLNYGNTF